MAPGAWSSGSFNGGAMPRATPRWRRSTKQSSVEHSTPDETLQLQTKPANALITFDTEKTLKKQFIIAADGDSGNPAYATADVRKYFCGALLTSTVTDYAAETATHKTIEVSRRLIQLESQRNVDLIVGADTVVELHGMIVEKPRNVKDACLSFCNSHKNGVSTGQQHKVYTGVVILLPHATGSLDLLPYLCRALVSIQEFGNLDEATITAYIATGEPMDKAGCYGIQDVGASLVKSVNGCFYNVVGFPIHR
ncbi:hypothetical protein SELMODRAFT_414888 [Selaginella moellendorffii]|uniref:Uncharacterized protein n=1 Tax=Selaginella moellendorffii TaxID=88036 RepID=D8RTW7_SELML|nr:hypothetical protein SELMODRAFT_414888 [Selaginella moellendorffii]